MKKLPPFQERVLANALGFTNSAYRPLQGVARVAAKGLFGRMMATLLSFLPFGKRPAKHEKSDRYPSGFNRSRENSRRIRQGWKNNLRRIE